MKRCNKTISVFTFILLFASFLFVPVNFVMADDAPSGKATSDADKDADKKKNEKAKAEKGKDKDKKGKDDEEPECE